MRDAPSDSFSDLNEEATAVNLDVNDQNTKVIVVESRRMNRAYIFGKYLFVKVFSFKYLGFTVNSNAHEAEEVMRISDGSRAYFSLRKRLKSYLV